MATRLAASLITFVMLASSGAFGEVKPDTGNARETRWTDGTLVRFDLGPTIGYMTSIGFEIRAERQLWTWRHGEIGVGGIFATHFNWLDDPFVPMVGGDYSGTDANIAIAPTVGHTFRVWGRRIGIATHLVAGMYIRAIDTELRDQRHDVNESHNAAAAIGFVGLGASFGVRFTDYLGLNLHGVMPLLGTNTSDVSRLWGSAKPYGGISLSIFV